MLQAYTVVMIGHINEMAYACMGWVGRKGWEWFRISGSFSNG